MSAVLKSPEPQASLFEYDGSMYPEYLKHGNAMQFIAPIALQFCRGWGVDVGCGNWPLPNAMPVDKKTKWQPTYLPRGLDYVFCARHDQRVITPFGRAEIGRIKRGDFVLGRSGFVRALAVCRTPFGGRLYRLETSEGVAVVTGNHPVATPLGWFDADHLRHSGEVFAVPSKIEPAQFIYGGNVVGSVAGLAPLGADLRADIVHGDAPSAEVQNDVRLPRLAGKKRADAGQQSCNGAQAASDEDHGAQLAAPARALVGRRRGVRDIAAGKNGAAFLDDCVIAVCDRDLGLQAAPGADANADAAFAVNHPGQVGPLFVTRIHRVSTEEYRGSIVNLETEDGTFFLENLLTHNSSHFLEHTVDPVRCLEYWLTRLKRGGVVFLHLPSTEMTYWHSTKNKKHLHEWEPAQMARMLRDLGYVNVIHSERDMAWSFSAVGWKP